MVGKLVLTRELISRRFVSDDPSRAPIEMQPCLREKLRKPVEWRRNMFYNGGWSNKPLAHDHGNETSSALLSFTDGNSSNPLNLWPTTRYSVYSGFS